MLLRADPLSRVSKNSDSTEPRWALEGNVTHVLPSAQAKSEELEATTQNEREPLLRDAADNGVCRRMHEGIPMSFLVAAELSTEGMQLGLVPYLSFPQGPSVVCVSSCWGDDGQLSVKTWWLPRTSCWSQAAKAVLRWGRIQPCATWDDSAGPQLVAEGRGDLV